ncbi:cupin domain-containing protein [Novosphingobium terrae]|uniref:cupin domain-containing protein n=1 Tax=Novosphingobium terrae TaxID=2726189 RepID=UPI00197F623E|nr:cupin domain-containing protein [Novosphingobium terrae]
MKTSIAIVSLAALSACMAGVAEARPGSSLAPVGPYHLSPARGPLRPVDLAPFKGRASSEILAGPSSGLDSSWVIYTRLAAHTLPQGAISLPVDHTFLVLKGSLDIEIGDERFTLKPETLALIPAGVPHRVWNAGGEEDAALEVVTPAPTRDLASLFRPATPRKIEHAAQYVRVAPPLGQLVSGTGHASLNERVLASRATGSAHVLERLNDMLPGGGRSETHLHPFDQVYFVRRGEMTVQYGMASYQAPANTLVVLPIGVAHNNLNNSNQVQSIVTLLLPEPEKGKPLGAGVTMTMTGGGTPPSSPKHED